MRLLLSLASCGRLHEATQATQAVDREACALCLGTIEEGDVLVARVIRVRNARCDSMAFAVSSFEWNRVARAGAVTGESIVAVFHSHPSGSSRPSPLDTRMIRASEIPWLIGVVAGTQTFVSAYRARSAEPMEVITPRCHQPDGDMTPTGRLMPCSVSVRRQ